MSIVIPSWSLSASLLLLLVISCSAAVQTGSHIDGQGPFVSPDKGCAHGECDLTMRPDIVLLKVCEYEIREFCLRRAVYDILTCLVENESEDGMSMSCRREITLQRWFLSPDFRRGPDTHPACAPDVIRLCTGRAMPSKQDFRHVRSVATCLKKGLADEQLSVNCAEYMRAYIREGSLDYKKDEALAFECQTEIRRHCQYAVPRSPDDARNGEMAECMKLKFMAHFISDPVCKEQVVTALRASRSEVRTDPLVYAPCYGDLRAHCSEVAPGEGRHMACLLEKLQLGAKMELQCMHMLRRRLAMWKFGAMVSPTSFPEYVVRRSYTSYIFAYMNYVVAGAALLLAIVFVSFLVLVISRKRRQRRMNDIAYIKLSKSEQTKSSY